MRTRWVRWFMAGAMAVAGVLAGSAAFAGWGSYGSYGGTAGWSPAWSSYGSSGGYVSYGSHGSWGSYGSFGSYGSHGGPVRAALRGLFHHHHRYYYGGFYSCGSSGGGVSWGSFGSHGSVGKAPYYHTPMSPPKEAPSEQPSMPTPMPMTPSQPQPGTEGTLPPPGSSASFLDEDRGNAMLVVSVPESARVFVNGRPTVSTGTQRRYVSRGLLPGMSYTYEVRAEATIDGQTVDEVKTVQLRAGETARLEFRLEPKPETTLTLKVPADARVVLAGNPTHSTGEVRVFRSRTLAPGQEWTDYRIQVSVERDGRVITKEESITLKGGESRTVEFLFEPAQSVASR